MVCIFVCKRSCTLLGWVFSPLLWILCVASAPQNPASLSTLSLLIVPSLLAATRVLSVLGFRLI